MFFIDTWRTTFHCRKFLQNFFNQTRAYKISYLGKEISTVKKYSSTYSIYVPKMNLLVSGCTAYFGSMYIILSEGEIC